MIYKKDYPYKFTREEQISLDSMFEELKDICNKYRGHDSEADTPYKYFINILAYSMKNYIEEIQDYIFYVHRLDEKTADKPSELKRALANTTNWMMETIKLFRYSKDTAFEMQFQKIDERCLIFKEENKNG